MIWNKELFDTCLVLLLGVCLRNLKREHSPSSKFVTDSVQNNTIEERVSLIEVQVADLREDITEVDEDVTALVENVNFLFDEQIIQDER